MLLSDIRVYRSGGDSCRVSTEFWKTLSKEWKFESKKRQTYDLSEICIKLIIESPPTLSPLAAAPGVLNQHVKCRSIVISVGKPDSKTFDLEEQCDLEVPDELYADLCPEQNIISIDRLIFDVPLLDECIVSGENTIMESGSLAERIRKLQIITIGQAICGLKVIFTCPASYGRVHEGTRIVVVKDLAAKITKLPKDEGRSVLTIHDQDSSSGFKILRVKAKLAPLIRSYPWEHLKPRPPRSFDSDMMLLVSWEILEAMECLPGSWIKVNVCHENSLNVCIWPFESQSNDIACASPRLLYSLIRTKSVLAEFVEITLERTLRSLLIERIEHTPKLARNVCLYPCYSESTNDKPSFVTGDKIIWARLGDLILDNHNRSWIITSINEQTKNIHHQEDVIYLLNRETQFLTGCNTIATRCPSSLIPNDYCLDLLSEDLRVLTDFFLPFLERNDFSGACSVLLAAPPGYGKTCFIECCAGILGLRTNVISCEYLSDLMEKETGSNIAEKLERAFSSINREGPSVLVLDNIEILLKLFETPNDQPSEEKQKGYVTISREEKWFIQVFKERLCEMSAQKIFVICTTEDLDKNPPHFRQVFDLNHHLGSYNIEALYSWLCTKYLLIDCPLSLVKSNWTGFSIREILDSLNLASQLCLSKIKNQNENTSLIRCDSGIVLKDDADAEAENAPLSASGLISSSDIIIQSKEFLESTKHIKKAHDHQKDTSFVLTSVPDVRWSDIGGLATAKKEILDTIHLPLTRPELFVKRDGKSAPLKKRSGILLYGPPGTGKTMLAKAIANTFQCAFLSIKGPELMNMYVGESEANIRRVFKIARENAPCVLFFDELDSVGGRKDQSGGGSVMERVVSQFLTELDSLQFMDSKKDPKNQMIFVVAATNRPDLLDPAFLRPGRFDRLIYLDVADSIEAQAKLLEAVCKRLPAKHLDFSALQEIASRIPIGRWTGADFSALGMEAWLLAVQESIDTIEDKLGEAERWIKRWNNKSDGQELTPQDLQRVSTVLKDEWHHDANLILPLSPEYYLKNLAPENLSLKHSIQIEREHFEKAIERIQPSVSLEELRHYRSVQEQFTVDNHRKQ